MMDSSESFCEFLSPTSTSMSSTRLSISADQDLELKEISRFLLDSPGPPQFKILSPTLSKLDHQEVAETEEVRTSIDDSNLFSFELETNGILRDLKIIPDTPDEIGWFDLIDTSGASGELDDIRLSPVPHGPSTAVPIQPNLDNSRVILPTDMVSTSISPPTPSRTFLANFRSDLKRGRKFIPPQRALRLENPDREYVDCEFSSADESFDYDMHSVLAVRPRTSSVQSSERYLHNEDLVNGRPGQRLQLSAEENRMLQAMGVRMPARFPLSRTEERALRTVRRKIRNKLSAQASRARRQEYVAELECRVKLSDQENQRLRRQIAHLQNDKRDLITHVRRLRSYVSKFLYKDDSFTPLPLFVRSNNKEKRSAKAAAQAAGGTSLLIVTFMILGWTALMPPTKTGSTPAVSGAHSGGLLSFFPGRSRSLLESSSSDERITPNSKVTLSSDIPGNHVSSVPKEVLEASDTQKTVNKINRIRLEDAPKDSHELNDLSLLGNHSDHTDRNSHDEETFNTLIEGDLRKLSEISLTSSVMNFPATVDL